MIHFKLYSPNNTYYGIPPAVSAAAAIVGDKFAKEYNIDSLPLHKEVIAGFQDRLIGRYIITDQARELL